MKEIKPHSKINCLLFKCDALLFATPVLSVRGVLSSEPCRAMSGRIRDFLGVFNDRGLVIGVLDFAARLNTGGARQEREIFLTFNTHQGVLAIAIDEVLDIEELQTGDGQDDLHDKVGNAYFYGMIKSSQGLVSLLDIRYILSVEELGVFRENAVTPGDVFAFNFNENVPAFEHLCRLQGMENAQLKLQETGRSVTAADVYRVLFETYRLVAIKFHLRALEERPAGEVNAAELFQLSFAINEKLVEKWGKQALSEANQAVYKKAVTRKRESQEPFTTEDVMQIVDYMQQIAAVDSSTT